MASIQRLPALQHAHSLNWPLAGTIQTVRSSKTLTLTTHPEFKSTSSRSLTEAERDLKAALDKRLDLSRLEDPGQRTLLCAWLVALNPENQGQCFEVTDGHWRIGRHLSADISLQDLCISSIHAGVRREGDSIFLHDLGSTSGTFINNQRITRRELRDGDRVTMGRADMIFRAVYG